MTRTDFEILCIGGVLLSLIGVIFWDHRSSDGEPFELWAGISVWPTTILRFCAAVASIAFIRKGMRDLTASREQLCDAELSIDRRWLASNALLPRRGADRRFRIRDALRDIFAWKWERAGAISTRMLCRWYFHKGRSSYRFIRIATATLVYLGFVFCLFTFTDGFPNAPYRGWRSKVTGNVVLAFSVIFTTALVFFVMDAIQLCSRFIYSLSQQTIGWPQKAIALADKSRHERFSEDLRELLIIRVIAHRTNVVGKLLVFPFTVLLLMIASRHSGFDYWTAPVPLMAVLGLLLGGLVVSGLMMRREANKIRRQVLSRLREHLSIAISESQVKRKEQLEHLIDEIGRERSGAFRPITDDYVFRALAIPFGGAGSLLLLEQLLP